MSHPLIVVDDDILGGSPVFAGTRVQIQTLFEYLERGLPLDEFLEDFPTVSLEHAQAVLNLTKQILLEYIYETVVG